MTKRSSNWRSIFLRLASPMARLSAGAISIIAIIFVARSPRILYAAEKSVLTILNNFAASRNIGRDQWLCHSGGFEQRSRRAFAIGRENDAIGLGDERPNIIRGPEVLDDTF